ncbi:MAG: hypothetical protein M3N43_01960, partial [Actinomycetota bacterium]|nr:hypothetical protein [Actinomycetota bacterium]
LPGAVEARCMRFGLRCTPARAYHRVQMVVDLVLRRLALFVGVVGLAFAGCGNGQAGDAPAAAGVSVSGFAGAAGTSGTSGEPPAMGGSVTQAGNAGAGTRAGSAGAGSEAGGAAAGETNAGGADAGGETSGSMDGGAPTVLACNPGTGFVGQLTGVGSAVPNGGILTTDPNSVAYGDANLDGVIAAYPEFDAVQAVDVDVHDVVVTATSGATPGPGVSAARIDFWIADDNALLQVSLDGELGPSCCPNFDLRSGMRLSFKATEVSTFISLGHITAASNFVAGSQNNCVLVAEPDLISDVAFYQMVRVSATLGDSYGNADARNWHTGLSSAAYDFISPNPNLQTGQTITFVGPVSPYVGFHLLVDSNPDWVTVTN